MLRRAQAIVTCNCCTCLDAESISTSQQAGKNSSALPAAADAVEDMQNAAGMAAELQLERSSVRSSSATDQTAMSTNPIQSDPTVALPSLGSTAADGSTAAPDHHSATEIHASSIEDTQTESAQQPAVQSALNISTPGMQLAGQDEHAPEQTSANTEALSVQADVESSPPEYAHQRLASQPSHNMACIKAQQPLLPQSSFSTRPSSVDQQASWQAISNTDSPEPRQESVLQQRLSEESSTINHEASADADAASQSIPAASDMTDATMRPAASVTEDQVPQAGSITSHTLHQPSVPQTSSQVATDTLHAAQQAGLSCAPDEKAGLNASVEAAAAEATQSSADQLVLESASRPSRIHSSAALDLDVSEQGQASSSAAASETGAGLTMNTAAAASETGASGLSSSQHSLPSLTDDADITAAGRDNGSSHVPELVPAYIPAPPQHSSTRSPAPRKGSFRHSMPAPSGHASSLSRANSSQARHSDLDTSQDPGSLGVPADSSLLVGQNQSEVQQGATWQTQGSGQNRHARTSVGAWPKLAGQNDMRSVQVCALLLWSAGLTCVTSQGQVTYPIVDTR